MEIKIQVNEHYKFLIEVTAIVQDDGVVVYDAKALNANLMSYWDWNIVYRENSIEGVINTIGNAIKQCIDKQLNDY